jgi:hypothetical protein
LPTLRLNPLQSRWQSLLQSRLLISLLKLSLILLLSLWLTLLQTLLLILLLSRLPILLLILWLILLLILLLRPWIPPFDHIARAVFRPALAAWLGLGPSQGLLSSL